MPCNLVAPALIAPEAITPTVPAPLQEAAREQKPVGRLGEHTEIARPVFLVSDASSFSTGHVTDGGYAHARAGGR